MTMLGMRKRWRMQYAKAELIRALAVSAEDLAAWGVAGEIESRYDLDEGDMEKLADEIAESLHRRADRTLL